MTKRRLIRSRLLCGLGCALVLGAGSATAQNDKAMEEIAKYRQMLQEGNPAELMELRGEELWNTPRGPNNVSLRECDLGLGKGVVEGAYAQLPRYFADTGKVQDIESRLTTCMTALQGMSVEEATKNWHKAGSDMEALVTYVGAQSKGKKITIAAQHPEEERMYRIGEYLFYRRAGPLDFSCSTCHADEGKRIRLQDLPTLATASGAQASMVTWPAYRVSQGNVWTMERRLIDCMRQMRYPDAEYLSDAMIALQIFMQKNANGALMQAPGIKR